MIVGYFISYTAVQTLDITMLEIFKKFTYIRETLQDIFTTKKFNDVIQRYSFYYISENIDIERNEEEEIKKNLKQSEIIIITQIKNQVQGEKKKILVCFEKTLIILEQSSLLFLYTILTQHQNIFICFFPKSEAKNIINKDVRIRYIEIEYDTNFTEDVSNIIQNIYIFQKFHTINQFWESIAPCLLGYLIQKSYFKMKKDRIIYFGEYKNILSIPKSMDDDEYIEIRLIGIGSIFKATLIYHIEREELLIIKTPNTNDSEIPKLIKRELENYLQIKSPFIPRLYGTIKDKQYIVIEFINGRLLENIKDIPLTNEDKYTIIFELMLIIKYFHHNNFIFRDLKPNNVMIDENKTAVLIDFDRMIQYDQQNSYAYDLTNNFQSCFMAPELNEQKNLSNKCDIYSLGKMIDFIMTNGDESVKKSQKIEDIIIKCTKKTVNDRPSINNLIHEYVLSFTNYIQMNRLKNFDEANYILGHFILLFKKDKESLDKGLYHLTLAADQNHIEAQLELGILYIDGHAHIQPDINKAIKYLTLAADQNSPDAQLNLGIIYYEGQYIAQNINKSIKYLTLAADQNVPDAQLNLGIIYYKGQYIAQNINKAIKYFTLAADQNIVVAQYNLGVIYIEGKYVPKNVEKAIHYFYLSANGNHKESQFNLGVIYYKGQYVKRNINMAIKYLMLSANQNFSPSFYVLGLIYHEGEYGIKDINKAIHYYSLASNQNDRQAQFKLGLIYYRGENGLPDLNKAVKFFTLSANQYYKEAQYNLGFIYQKEFKFRDINKAIYYYTLAANQNFYDAFLNLGNIYYTEQKNINKAIHYYSLAANAGFSQAQYSLGYIYYKDDLIPHDINKAILYFTKAACNNHLESQFALASIYQEGIYVLRNINKAIEYYSIAASQNHVKSMNNLADIYIKGQYIAKDINKGIYYYETAANQNNVLAQYNLGILYYEGKYLKQDLKKSFHYFCLSAAQKHPDAQYILAAFYFNGIYVKQNINKAIQYFTLSSNQNDSRSQLILGIFYCDGFFTKQDIKKGIYLITLASKNKNIKAQFVLGYLYHEGNIIKRDIQKAIKLYKEASSFNYQYAKNNLGVIYKYGFGEEIKADIGKSIEYFKEAIQQKKDYLSMYNLANIYFYDERIKQDINKSIELLIESSNQFDQSLILLSLVLIKQFGLEYSIFQKIIHKYTNQSSQILSEILEIINDLNLNDPFIFQQIYDSYRNELFLYEYHLEIISYLDVQKYRSNQMQVKQNKAKNINSKFYDGFGNELL